MRLNSDSVSEQPRAKCEVQDRELGHTQKSESEKLPSALLAAERRPLNGEINGELEFLVTNRRGDLVSTFVGQSLANERTKSRICQVHTIERWPSG